MNSPIRQTLDAASQLPGSSAPRFEFISECWICGGRQLEPWLRNSFQLNNFREQDPELATYSGEGYWLKRCADCGFAQPEKLPSLPRYFERLYDQHWSDEWIAGEFSSTQKDLIETTILDELGSRLPPSRRTLLDVGAHVGRFLHLAEKAGWRGEGIELNPRTAAAAERNTRSPIHRMDAGQLVAKGQTFSAVTLTDVLEHIPRPLAVLKTLAKVVEPGGSIAVKVPCGPNQALKERVRVALRTTDEVSIGQNLVHVNQFSPSSLRLALEYAGFDSVSIGIGAPEFFPVEAGQFAPRFRLSNALRMAVYRVGRSLPGGTHTPLALNLQAYARIPS